MKQLLQTAAVCALLAFVPQAALASDGLMLAAIPWRSVAAVIIMVVCLSAMAWMKHKDRK